MSCAGYAAVQQRCLASLLHSQLTTSECVKATLNPRGEDALHCHGQLSQRHCLQVGKHTYFVEHLTTLMYINIMQVAFSINAKNRPGCIANRST